MSKNKDNLEKSIHLFLQHTNYSKENITSIKQIHHGFTNVSFEFMTFDNQKFQVRLGGSNHIVDRKNEYYILQTIKEPNYIFIDENGNAIKKWIDGINPIFDNNNECEMKKLLSLLMEEIVLFHSHNINNSKIIVHDYFIFYNLTNFENIDDKKNYKILCDKYKDLELVLSHNDINDKNVLYNKAVNKIFLIDFEWGRINNRYFDVANFIREMDIDFKYIDYILEHYKQLDKQILLDFIYITTNFAYQWTFAMEKTDKILEYRNLMKDRMDKYRSIISIH